MTVVATAITIFHPPADVEGFSRWVAGYMSAARHTEGYVSGRESVQGTQQLDWAVEVRFESADLLDAWLESPERSAVLREGEACGYWRCSSDLILLEGEPPPADAAVFLHSVAPGKEAEFVAAQSDLTLTSCVFPGYEGTALFPADASGQWTSVLRFRTPYQLAGWIGSRERKEALPRLREELTRDFADLSRSAPFGSTIRVSDGETRITPAWKTSMLVVLCLYPTVMLLSKWLSPALSRLGVGAAAAIFVGNVISVVLLQWVLVPAASRPFRRWLDPIDGAAARITVTGAAVIVLAYAALVALFAFGRF
jgi:uncharacterized protein